jgi:uncharacterized coiled-coil protein SlyX
MSDHGEALEKRLEDLEVRIAFQEKSFDDLNQALAEETQRSTRMEAEIHVLKEALRRLSSRGKEPEVLGAMPEDDPVPNSG